MSKLDHATVAKWLSARVNAPDVNKSTFGHVAVIGGSIGLFGAPVLTSHAAMRAGAGLVTLASPSETANVVNSRLSPVIMTLALPQTPAGTVSAMAIPSAIDLANRVTTVAIGPGLGVGRDVEEFVKSIISECESPIVIDADALNAIARDVTIGSDLIRRRKAATVLTPHPKELGRLLSISTSEVQADRSAAVRRAVETFGCVVILKGDRTLISGPSGLIFENPTGNAGMATAGSGDVLTGVTAAILAQGLDPLHAASAAVYVHGLAADLAVSTVGGMAGLIATDIIDHLPRAIGSLHHGP